MEIIRHPNGFLKITLTSEDDGTTLRIHAWDDHCPDDTHIHQHRADYTSTILEGSMNEEIWACTDDPAGNWERTQARCYTTPDGTYHVEEHAPPVSCRIEPRQLLTHKKDDTYHRPATDLHRILPVRLPLITLIRTGPTYNEIHSIIRKKPPDQAKPRTGPN